MSDPKSKPPALEVFLANPRSFCAGVVRAIRIVETALEVYGPPVYVLHEIVHNRHVVDDLAARGAVFVEDLADIPPGSVAIFSAHGVSRQVADEARRRQLQTIDATCPLVAKVHLEVQRHARAGKDVVLVGHQNHPEIVGTLGRYPREAGGEIHLVGSVADVERLTLRDPQRVAYVTQTTLSVDDAAQTVAALRRRFPAITGPRQDDICYATQNRQNAVRQLAGRVDLLLVVGARNSSNSNRLRELGEQMGLPSYLLEHEGELDPAWLEGCQRVGLTAGASAPESVVQRVLARLRQLGAVSVVESPGEAETVSFRLPAGLVQPA